MVLTVQFHNKEDVFCGKKYCYSLLKDEEVPTIGSIIRLYDENYNKIANGTRVKVTSIRASTPEDNFLKIRYNKELEIL